MIRALLHGGLIALLLAFVSCQRSSDSDRLARRSVEQREPPDAATPTPPPPPTAAMVRVDTPESGALITSPVLVSGRARGSWYFEAEFPVRLLGGKGQMIGTGVARAQGDWQTTEYVPFEVSITFHPAADDSTGTLVFEKSNPSGNSEHAAEVRVPVRFR